MMISCTLGEKKYTVDYVTGRALREMEPAAKMYAKIVAVANAAAKGETLSEEETFTIPEAMDVMIRWFCILFGNQFTVDDVLDHYPVDRLMHDVALALLAAVWAGDDALLSALGGVAGNVEKLLTYMPEKLAGLVKDYENIQAAVVLGRGFAYPIACEGTLKILETNGIKMRGYAVSDFHHGPKAQVHPGDTAIVVALRGAVLDDAAEMIDELLKIGAKVIVITDDASLSEKAAVQGLLIPNDTNYSVPDAVSAFCAAVTLQLFALELVLARGIDPDASKVLKKVTITV